MSIPAYLPYFVLSGTTAIVIAILYGVNRALVAADWTAPSRKRTVRTIAAVLIGWWYWRRQRFRIAPAPPQPAHVLALQALHRLEQQNLIGQQQIDAFYVQLSAILRRYVEWRFRLRAPEQTTEEFLAATLTSGGLLTTHRDALRTFLQHCDLVKFARHEPTADDMQRTFDSAKAFVNQTADDQVVVAADAVGAEA